MKHYRRKRLLAALNEMYLVNVARSKSYTDFLIMEKGLTEQSNTLRHLLDLDEAQRSAQLQQTQLPLFTVEQYFEAHRK
jgi:hypothetical protein